MAVHFLAPVICSKEEKNTPSCEGKVSPWLGVQFRPRIILAGSAFLQKVRVLHLAPLNSTRLVCGSFYLAAHHLQTLFVGRTPSASFLVSDSHKRGELEGTVHPLGCVLLHKHKECITEKSTREGQANFLCEASIRQGMGEEWWALF